MGKPDTLRVLYRKVFVRKVWRLVQLDLLGIGFRTYVWSLQRVSESKLAENSSGSAMLIHATVVSGKTLSLAGNAGSSAHTDPTQHTTA